MVKPNLVAIELCSNRVGILNLDEDQLFEQASNLNVSKMRASIKQVRRHVMFCFGNNLPTVSFRMAFFKVLCI